MSNILEEINTFLECSKAKTLEVTFAQLKIDSYHNGKILKSVYRPNSKIILGKPQNSSRIQMDVVDNLVFSFSFEFAKPKATFFYKDYNIKLPRPLAHGSLQIDSEKLILEFIIDSSNKNSQVQVKHFYTHILSVTSQL